MSAPVHKTDDHNGKGSLDAGTNGIYRAEQYDFMDLLLLQAQKGIAPTEEQVQKSASMPLEWRKSLSKKTILIREGKLEIEELC